MTYLRLSVTIGPYCYCCSVDVRSDSVTPWTVAGQASRSFTIYQHLLKLMSVELVMPSNHLILCHPFSCPQSSPASGPFPMSWFFTSGNQSIRASASASVLPVNIQGWFLLGLTGLISLQLGDSQESYPTPQFESISSLVLGFLYGSTLTSIQNY